MVKLPAITFIFHFMDWARVMTNCYFVLEFVLSIIKCISCENLKKIELCHFFRLFDEQYNLFMFFLNPVQVHIPYNVLIPDLLLLYLTLHFRDSNQNYPSKCGIQDKSRGSGLRASYGTSLMPTPRFLLA